MGLALKAAIVTGGASGIGRAIALRFAREGAQVLVADIDPEGGQQTVETGRADGGVLVFHRTDVSRWDDVRDMVAAAVAEFGRLDALVNNAGLGLSRAVDQTTEEECDRILDTNLKGVWMGCRFAVPEMKRAGGGSIINIASVHALEGYKLDTVYAASKGGILSATIALAVELAESRIRVNAICPGLIKVRDTWAAWRTHVPPERWQAFVETFADRIDDYYRCYQPLPEVGEPDDIASAALYLASDEARFVTGANVVVDGGLTVRMPKNDDPYARARETSARIEAWIKERQ